MNSIQRDDCLYKTIAIVDDNVELCLLLEKFLQKKSFRVSIYNSSTDFLNESCEKFDVILLDLFMPDPDGISVLRILAERCYPGAILLMSGEDQGVLRAALELARAQQVRLINTIQKPFHLDVLSVSINELVNASALSNKKIADHWHPQADDLVEAIQSQQLCLYYQPKIELKNSKLSGFEALLRWLHPEHGLIMPDRFISMAEQDSFLMQLLTDEVIRIAIEQLVCWKHQGFEARLSINVSMLNLVRLDFPEALQNLLLQRNLNLAQLQLEVTETALMNEVATSLDILLRLKMKGFGLSIDDFGTGYSSLAQLHRIPFSELKIDRSFVMTMATCNESKAIVETCIKLGQRLGLKVVAEGVENKNVAESLCQMGCDIGQGYFWSKAVPAAETSLWF
jgi:EAL domain-containing protein (putative c-di-GMP-specific phosphodiesterase class I)/ActR/RegA family two-component response regulator